MALLIDGQIVATYDAISSGGDTFVFETATTLSASQVQVAFTNDVYDPANGVDYNLIVDAIAIDGTRFETEDGTVYSTGTWRFEDGITSGFGRGDILHGLGSFSYGEDPDAPPPTDLFVA
ncbi:MAG: carbohydrate-binding domain-containing protein [Pseudomonadota bacterium]